MKLNAANGASTILGAADEVPPNGGRDQDWRQRRCDLDHNFDQILMLSNGRPQQQAAAAGSAKGRQSHGWLMSALAAAANKGREE